ncbi:MAG: hypothetical protein PWP51_1952 [Clostridiales bacterium]|jgi:hypothetical protein|nr:hypothetical protein [Clostridiales bacterium]MDN5299399.1 hypothetical protein [Clostridiales bacterium]
MNGFVTVTFEAFAECIDLASGEPDAFKALVLKRMGDCNGVTVTDHDNPCFSIQFKEPKTLQTFEHLDDYVQELDHWF